MPGKKWTATEKQILLSLRLGQNLSFEQISPHIEGKSANACQIMFNRLSQTGEAILPVQSTGTHGPSLESEGGAADASTVASGEPAMKVDWTKEEDDLLIAAYSLHMNDPKAGFWVRISRYFDEQPRTPRAVMWRYRKLRQLDPSLPYADSSKHWQPAEDDLLVSARDNGDSFDAIATRIPRSARACEARYKLLTHGDGEIEDNDAES